MIIYNATKTEFQNMVLNDRIADVLRSNIKQRMHHTTAESEFHSWGQSLKDMSIVLADSEIPVDAGVAIEYNIPQTSKRVDFILSGYDHGCRAHCVVIELKQWTKLDPVEGSDGLVRTFTGNRERNVVHPSYQAWSYAALLSNFNQSVQNNLIGLHPCAFLLNYHRKGNPDPLDYPQYRQYLEEAPAFGASDKVSLRSFIKRFISTGDKGKIIYQIDNGKIKPSKSLQDSLASMMAGNREFVMIDDQKVAYETILERARSAKATGRKQVVIVQGGPGTGKSVVAINALVKLTQEDQFCQYVSKNSAPRNVYKAELKGHKKQNAIDVMFMSSGVYCNALCNSVDTLLIDEAHRLNEKSGMFHNLGENQIRELIHAAKCSVFFIDEFQRVTMQDIGSIAEIERWAKKENALVTKETLASQFRCNGSDGYLAWLDDVLGIRETANVDLEGVDYDFRVFDSPDKVFDLIVEKNKSRNKSRMVAGYCWEWNTKGKNNPNYHDIAIGDFEKSWNLDNTGTYAIDEGSVNEIGCIHTVQGLEFDYVGVIIGEDLRFENGKVITDYAQRASTDRSLWGIKKLIKDNPEKGRKLADEIIRNTYRTLMTRGMKGCYVYCVDQALAGYLKRRIGGKI